MMPFSLNIKGRLLTYNRPAVMGILNVTPDSFYAGSHTFNAAAIEDRAKQIISEGADIIDLGGYSSRPGADDVSVEEEIRRIRMGMQIIRKISPDIPVSVDTFRADIASEAIEKWDADIINDISMGQIDSEMFPTVARLRVPYILMHMRGTPATMQQHTDYSALWQRCQRRSNRRTLRTSPQADSRRCFRHNHRPRIRLCQRPPAELQPSKTTSPQ